MSLSHVALLLVSYLMSAGAVLNVDEGSPCVTAGIHGVCTIIYKCLIPLHTYTYRNAGFSEDRYDFPELPEICSYKNKYPVVCCTDCNLRNDSKYKDATVNPYGMLVPKTGKPAIDKCADYFQNLPYPCRGRANVKFQHVWNKQKKCHELIIEAVSPVGGRDAQRWEFPHMALLGFGDDVDTAQWLCGGTVISERFVLTAAHCTSTWTLGSIAFAALGLLKRSDPKEYWKIYKIKRIIIYPEYKAPSKYHDIALLETETEINFGRDLLPACLDTEVSYPRSADAAGWGRVGHRQELADNLQVVTLSEYNQSECSAIYKSHRLLKRGYDHATQMCYGSRRKVVDTCEGDSGGPLQIHTEECVFTVLGVTSYGKNCGILGSAGMYTRVSHYVPWIESIVWPSSEISN